MVYINSDLGGLNFKEEAGIKYVRGADAVWVPLGKPTYLGTASGSRYARWTFDTKSLLSIYKSLTIDNFMFVLSSVRLQASNTADAYYNFSAAYDATTGIITETSTVSCGSPANGDSAVKIYYVP